MYQWLLVVGTFVVAATLGRRAYLTTDGSHERCLRRAATDALTVVLFVYLLGNGLWFRWRGWTEVVLVGTELGLVGLVFYYWRQESRSSA